MKKGKKLRITFALSGLCFGVVTVILLHGCNKMTTKEDDTKSNSVSQLARNYFSNLSEREKTASNGSTGVPQKKIISKRIAPLSTMSELIQWQNAKEVTHDQLTYTVVPLKDDLKKFKSKDYEFFRNIIYYQDEQQMNHMVILEVLSKKGESLGNDLQNVAITAFENKYFSRTESIGDLNAYVIFYNENYDRDISFELKKGKWLPARISFRSDLEITQ